jgi:hypothetical protein
MGMKWTMISKALGDETPLQVKNRWYFVLPKRKLSVFDDIDTMMTLRSRVRKGESIPDLILDEEPTNFLHECVTAQKLLRPLSSWTSIKVENC